MIEVRSNKDRSKSHKWIKRSIFFYKYIADFSFGRYDYKINGVVFTSRNSEFKEAFSKELTWARLNDRA